ncbi:MAG: translation initiation factor IF-2 [Cyanobacteria bacterium J06648_11]
MKALVKAGGAKPSDDRPKARVVKKRDRPESNRPQILDIRPPGEEEASATPPQIVAPPRPARNGAERRVVESSDARPREPRLTPAKPVARSPHPARPESPARGLPELRSPVTPRRAADAAPLAPQVRATSSPQVSAQRPEPPAVVSPPTPPAPAAPPRQQLAKPIARPTPNRADTPRPVKRAGSDRPSQAAATPQKPQIVSPPKAPVKPQLVGSPTRPKPAGTTERAKPIARGDRSGERSGAPQKPAPPVKPKLELVGPPIRAKDVRKVSEKTEKPAPKLDAPGQDGAPPDNFPLLVDAPKRPTRSIASPRRKPAASVEDDMAALLRPPSRVQAKKKRRRGTDVDSDDNLDAVDTAVSAAKQAELDALKPLPRPTAKPPSTHIPKPPPAATKRRAKPQTAAQRAAAKAARHAEVEETKPTLLELEGTLTVQELADRLCVPGAEIIKILFLKGLMVNLNQTLDIPTIETVAEELEVTIELKDEEAAAKKTEMLDLTDIEHLTLRPPVVTIMGHVDHGKTTLLDSIRATKVASGEAGGITQHIGAYHVDLEHDGDSKRVVFLDTPGHEAFTAMRARGAKVTDIAVLVVAADDGVQPQTLEAISHAKAAEVPIVVAVNKIDKDTANPDRVKQELAERGLMPEEWGGDTPMVGVSALAKQNLDELLEMLLLVAEVAELQANPDRPAKGTVVEANLDKARGPVATLLVQNGTLRVGDTIVAGSTLGRVRAMVDDRGQRVMEAGPSSAVEILGMNDVPAAGDEFDAYTDEKEARQVADRRASEQRQTRLQQAMASRRVSLGSLSAQAQEGELKELNLILKADVQGSAEAILGSLEQLPQDEVQIRVLLAAPGEVSETDVDLAAASEAIVIGFNTSLAPGAQASADRQGVDVRNYDIIYNLLEDIRGAMEGLLEPEEVEEPLGQVEVRQVIAIGKGAIAGCYVQSGKVTRNALARVRRGGDVIHEGRIDSLKRFKDDVKEVASGFECGINIDRFHDWQDGDILEVFQMVSKRRTLTV